MIFTVRAAVFPSWMDFSSTENSPTTSDSLDDDVSGLGSYEIDADVSEIGKREQRRQNESSIMNNIMRQTGWTEAKEAMAIKPVGHPETVKTGTQWKVQVKEMRQCILDKRTQAGTESTACETLPISITPANDHNHVKVVDKSYLERHHHSEKFKPIIDSIVQKFMLNCEQERAFHVVANHACTQQVEQLKMYLGGMGGTGKTQVLKSLIEFFNLTNQSHRFVVVAPTGSAAALLGGSTYHYLFGFGDRPDDNLPTHLLLQLRARLEGVDYIFLDEVSMLSCHDMYRISLRLSKILNVSDLPFGGMNMVFAGDFAQLPPAIGQENAALYSRTVGTKSTSLRDQESAVGKALWHQVTIVVILRQNMRQKTQTKNDAALRCALTNMRYKACTAEDISSLRTRISSALPGRPSINQECFNNVSIITALNVHKDEINRLGSLRFATETCQDLIDFYSEDSVGSGHDKGSRKGGQKAKSKSVITMTDRIQDAIWSQPPCSNDKCIPGKLSLCIGMPVIIRSNSATELCITRGQEGTVHCWQSTIGSKGQRVLDTLFVQLQNPPRSVQFEGLPKNVVPLTRTSTSIKCSLPNDDIISINRSQVEVLPNFAMTDYSSQGKTRPFNPVDLNNCRSHQSYYTVLSRSASAAGTCILQGFDSRMITGGASGALRQEFRELELLDEITRLRYNGKLHASVVGDRRRTLIHKFRLWKGENYVPPNVHRAIRWTKGSPLQIEDDDEITWHIVEKKPITKSASANENASTSCNVSMSSNAKRKIDSTDHLECASTMTTTKKVKAYHHTDIDHVEGLMPPSQATVWSDNSCAYDSVVALIHAVWSKNHVLQTDNLKSLGNHMLDELVDRFTDHLNEKCLLEDARDMVRRCLIEKAPNDFPWGAYVSIDGVLFHLLETNNTILTSECVCPQGHHVNRRPVNLKNCLLNVLDNFSGSAQYWITRLETRLSSKC